MKKTISTGDIYVLHNYFNNFDSYKILRNEN